MTLPALEGAALTGERVHLRPLELADAERAFEILRGNERVLRWLVWDGPRELRDLEELYSNWITPSEQGCDYHFAIVERASGAFCGSIGPRFAGHPSAGDVGYWLAPEYWGRGFMTEAVRLVCHLSFRHLAAELLFAYVFVGNEGSRKVLERSGFTLAHTAKEKVVKRGRAIDEWYFTLLRGEFETRFGGWRPVAEDVRLAC